MNMNIYIHLFTQTFANLIIRGEIYPCAQEQHKAYVPYKCSKWDLCDIYVVHPLCAGSLHGVNFTHQRYE